MDSPLQTKGKRLENVHVSVACEACKKRRVKCNGQIPCSQCRKRDIKCSICPEADKRRKNSERDELRQVLESICGVDKSRLLEALRAIERKAQPNDASGVTRVTPEAEEKDNSPTTASEVFVSGPGRVEIGQNQTNYGMCGESSSTHLFGRLQESQTTKNEYPRQYSGQSGQWLSEANNITESSELPIPDARKDAIIRLYEEVFTELLPQVTLEQRKMIMNVVAQARMQESPSRGSSTDAMQSVKDTSIGSLRSDTNHPRLAPDTMTEYGQELDSEMSCTTSELDQAFEYAGQQLVLDTDFSRSFDEHVATSIVLYGWEHTQAHVTLDFQWELIEQTQRIMSETMDPVSRAAWSWLTRKAFKFFAATHFNAPGCCQSSPSFFVPGVIQRSIGLPTIMAYYPWQPLRERLSLAPHRYHTMSFFSDVAKSVRFRWPHNPELATSWNERGWGRMVLFSTEMRNRVNDLNCFVVTRDFVTRHPELRGDLGILESEPSPQLSPPRIGQSTATRRSSLELFKSDSAKEDANQEIRNRKRLKRSHNKACDELDPYTGG